MNAAAVMTIGPLPLPRPPLPTPIPSAAAAAAAETQRYTWSRGRDHLIAEEAGVLQSTALGVPALFRHSGEFNPVFLPVSEKKLN